MTVRTLDGPARAAQVGREVIPILKGARDRLSNQDVEPLRQRLSGMLPDMEWGESAPELIAELEFLVEIES